jgi:undecaprenyl-diphosphatase
MTLIQAIILGIVQGATEFLPISSTAHLTLVPWFFGWTDPGLGFDMALHLGTLVALLLYFRVEWWNLTLGALDILRGRRDRPDAKLISYIIIGTIPALIAGVLFADFADSTLRHPLIIASAMMLLAGVLVIAEKVGRRNIKLDEISMSDAVAVGCAQAVAIIPGVSRSGGTITAALFRGMTREAAARFSFLLSAPIIAAAVSKGLLDGVRHGFPATSVSAAIAGIVVSGIVGYLSIAFLIRYLATRSTYVFVIYRFILGIVIFAVYFSRG